MYRYFYSTSSTNSFFHDLYIILDEFLKQSNYTFFFPSIDYPIVSIEDPFDKEDWEHFKHFSNLGICQVGLSFFLFGEFVSAVSP